MSKPIVLADANGLNPLLTRLEAWPKLPKSPSQRTCILCGCVEPRGCEGGCAWQDLHDGSNWGLCTLCLDGKVCGIGESLIMAAFCGDRWTRKVSCPCPVCRATAPTKRKGVRR